MTTIRNPILPGFNPDPSICRVGEDYYIATSTFEWYPGVQIHHSRDLANWRLVRRPLERASQLDLRGDPDSGGVWAPCLSYADGRFWLVYTDVKRLDGDFKDAHNYHRHRAFNRGPLVGPRFRQFERLRPLALSRRRRTEVVRQYDLELPRRRGRRPEQPCLCRHPAAGMGRRLREADRTAKKHLRRKRARPRRGPASLQAQRLVLPDDCRGRDGLRPRGDDGSLPPDRRALRTASERPSPHLEGRA